MGKRIRRWLIIVASTYGAACLFVGMFQSRLIYFPDREYDATPSDVGLAFERIALATSDGETLAAWYVPAADAKSTILYFHGTGGNMSDRLAALQLLHRLGYHVLMVDYRGYGESTGTPGEHGMYRDAEAAWRFLVDSKQAAPEHIVFWGRSLGGAIAIELASRHEPAALVVESTFTRMADVARIHYALLPVDWMLTQRFPSVDHVAQMACPKLFFHGRDDGLIPLSIGKRLFDAAAEPKRFIETPGGHRSGGFASEAWHVEMVEAFLEAALEGD
ncbi:MAG: alpha/beta hydrolase [Phycisphaerae bacterium]